MDKEDESISALVDNFLNSEIEKKTNELSLLQTWIQNVRNRMNVLRNDIGLPQNYQIPTEYFSSGRRPKDNELMSMIQNDSNKTNLTFTVGDTSRFCGPKLPRVHSDLFNSVYLHEECRLNCLSSVKNEVTHYWTFYIQNGNHTFNAMNYIDYVIVKYPFNNHLKQIKMTGPHFRIGDKSSSNVPLDITIYFKSSIRKASDTNTNCVYYKFQHYVELNSSITKKEVVGSNKRHIIPVKIEDNDDVDDDDDTIKSEYHPYDTATSDYDMPSGNELDRHCEKCDLFGDFYSDGNDIDFPNVTVSSESEDVLKSKSIRWIDNMRFNIDSHQLYSVQTLLIIYAEKYPLVGTFVSTMNKDYKHIIVERDVWTTYSMIDKRIREVLRASYIATKVKEVWKQRCEKNFLKNDFLLKQEMKHINEIDIPNVLIWLRAYGYTDVNTYSDNEIHERKLEAYRENEVEEIIEQPCGRIIIRRDQFPIRNHCTLINNLFDVFSISSNHIEMAKDQIFCNNFIKIQPMMWEKGKIEKIIMPIKSIYDYYFNYLINENRQDITMLTNGDFIVLTSQYSTYQMEWSNMMLNSLAEEIRQEKLLPNHRHRNIVVPLINRMVLPICSFRDMENLLLLMHCRGVSSRFTKEQADFVEEERRIAKWPVKCIDICSELICTIMEGFINDLIRYICAVQWNNNSFSPVYEQLEDEPIVEELTTSPTLSHNNRADDEDMNKNKDTFIIQKIKNTLNNSYINQPFHHIAQHSAIPQCITFGNALEAIVANPKYSWLHSNLSGRAFSNSVDFYY